MSGSPVIAELLRAAEATLRAASESSRLDAEVLLSCVLGKPRTHLHAWPESHATPAQAAQYGSLIERRRSGVPVAYLTGYCEFFSLRLAVDDRVLIPRPETERVVELALERIPATAGSVVLDAGTGSGAIALAVARNREHCRLIASDVSVPALELAQRNALALGCRNLHFVAGDWLLPFAAHSFDIIVANPPYVRDNDPHLRHVWAEPRAALAGGADGLDPIRRLVAAAPAALRARGWLILEHGYDQGAEVTRIAARGGFASVESVRDLAGHDRAICARKA